MSCNPSSMNFMHHMPVYRLALAVIRSVAIALGALTFALPSLAAEPAPASFQHKDWELQCDNTRTCRAAGYQAEDSDSEPVSILLKRDAGPNTPVEIQLHVQSEKPYTGTLQLKVGRVLIRGLKGDTAQIPAAETPALIQQLLDNETVIVSAGKQTWTLSLAGAKATLLKMDEAQGRIGTPGALVRRGNKPEASVLLPLPTPLVKAARPLATRPADQALAQKIFAAIPKKERDEAREECNDNELSREVKGTRLNEHALLIAMSCSLGAYNFTTLLWMADDRPPYKPHRMDIDGEFDADSGIVSSTMKGRGLGDCWSATNWQYNGQDFTLASRSGDGMCRGFPGGAWGLPAYVSKVVAPK